MAWNLLLLQEKVSMDVNSHSSVQEPGCANHVLSFILQKERCRIHLHEPSQDECPNSYCPGIRDTKEEESGGGNLDYAEKDRPCQSSEGLQDGVIETINQHTNHCPIEDKEPASMTPV